MGMVLRENKKQFIAVETMIIITIIIILTVCKESDFVSEENQALLTQVIICPVGVIIIMDLFIQWWMKYRWRSTHLQSTVQCYWKKLYFHSTGKNGFRISFSTSTWKEQHTLPQLFLRKKSAEFKVHARPLHLQGSCLLQLYIFYVRKELGKHT